MMTDLTQVTLHTPGVERRPERLVTLDELPPGFYIVNPGASPAFWLGPYRDLNEAELAWYDRVQGERIMQVFPKHQD